MVALMLKSGQMLWKTFDMPDNGGRTDQYSGGAVWQPLRLIPSAVRSSSALETNYTVPADVVACQNANPTANCACA